MNDTIEPSTSAPEKSLLITMIDAALTECSGRSIVSAAEMADMLLDIRAAAVEVGDV